jgi:hypothetical protein
LWHYFTDSTRLQSLETKQSELRQEQEVLQGKLNGETGLELAREEIEEMETQINDIQDIIDFVRDVLQGTFKKVIDSESATVEDWDDCLKMIEKASDKSERVPDAKCPDLIKIKEQIQFAAKQKKSMEQLNKLARHDFNGVTMPTLEQLATQAITCWNVLEIGQIRLLFDPNGDADERLSSWRDSNLRSEARKPTLQPLPVQLCKEPHFVEWLECVVMDKERQDGNDPLFSRFVKEAKETNTDDEASNESDDESGLKKGFEGSDSSDEDRSGSDDEGSSGSSSSEMWSSESDDGEPTSLMQCKTKRLTAECTFLFKARTRWCELYGKLKDQTIDFSSLCEILGRKNRAPSENILHNELPLLYCSCKQTDDGVDIVTDFPFQENEKNDEVNDARQEIEYFEHFRQTFGVKQMQDEAWKWQESTTLGAYCTLRKCICEQDGDEGCDKGACGAAFLLGCRCSACSSHGFSEEDPWGSFKLLEEEGEGARKTRVYQLLAAAACLDGDHKQRKQRLSLQCIVLHVILTKCFLGGTLQNSPNEDSWAAYLAGLRFESLLREADSWNVYLRWYDQAKRFCGEAKEEVSNVRDQLESPKQNHCRTFEHLKDELLGGHHHKLLLHRSITVGEIDHGWVHQLVEHQKKEAMLSIWRVMYDLDLAECKDKAWDVLEQERNSGENIAYEDAAEQLGPLKEDLSTPMPTKQDSIKTYTWKQCKRVDQLLQLKRCSSAASIVDGVEDMKKLNSIESNSSMSENESGSDSEVMEDVDTQGEVGCDELQIQHLDHFFRFHSDGNHGNRFDNALADLDFEPLHEQLCEKPDFVEWLAFVMKTSKLFRQHCEQAWDEQNEVRRSELDQQSEINRSVVSLQNAAYKWIKCFESFGGTYAKSTTSSSILSITFEALCSKEWHEEQPNVVKRQLGELFSTCHPCIFEPGKPNVVTKWPVPSDMEVGNNTLGLEVEITQCQNWRDETFEEMQCFRRFFTAFGIQKQDLSNHELNTYTLMRKSACKRCHLKQEENELFTGEEKMEEEDEEGMPMTISYDLPMTGTVDPQAHTKARSISIAGVVMGCRCKDCREQIRRVAHTQMGTVLTEEQGQKLRELLNKLVALHMSDRSSATPPGSEASVASAESFDLEALAISVERGLREMCTIAIARNIKGGADEGLLHERDGLIVDLWGSFSNACRNIHRLIAGFGSEHRDSLTLYVDEKGSSGKGSGGVGDGGDGSDSGGCGSDGDDDDDDQHTGSDDDDHINYDDIFSRTIVATIASAQHDQSVAEQLVQKAKALRTLVLKIDELSNLEVDRPEQLREAIWNTRVAFKLAVEDAQSQTTDPAEDWGVPWARLDADQKRDLILAVVEEPATTESMDLETERVSRCTLQCMVLEKALNNIYDKDFGVQPPTLERVNELLDQADIWHACLSWYTSTKPLVDVAVHEDRLKGVAMGFMRILRLVVTNVCPIGSLHLLNLRFPVSHSSLAYRGEADKALYAGRKRIDICTGKGLKTVDGIWPLLRSAHDRSWWEEAWQQEHAIETLDREKERQEKKEKEARDVLPLTKYLRKEFVEQFVSNFIKEDNKAIGELSVLPQKLANKSERIRNTNFSSANVWCTFTFVHHTREFEQRGKPRRIVKAGVDLNRAELRSSDWPSNSFKLLFEDGGGPIVVRAPSLGDKREWLEIIDAATKTQDPATVKYTTQETRRMTESRRHQLPTLCSRAAISALASKVPHDDDGDLLHSCKDEWQFEHAHATTTAAKKLKEWRELLDR